MKMKIKAVLIFLNYDNSNCDICCHIYTFCWGTYVIFIVYCCHIFHFYDISYHVSLFCAICCHMTPFCWYTCRQAMINIISKKIEITFIGERREEKWRDDYIKAINLFFLILTIQTVTYVATYMLSGTCLTTCHLSVKYVVTCILLFVHMQIIVLIIH